MEDNKVFNSAISEAADSLMGSDKFKEMVYQKVEKSLNEAIVDALRYSSASKALSKKVEAGLTLAIENVDMPEMFHFMSEIMKETVNKHYQGIAKEHFIKALDEALLPMPKEMTMQDLLNLVIEPIRDENRGDPCSFNEDETVEIEFETEDKYGCKWHTLEIWLEGKTRKGILSSVTRDNRSDIRIRFRDGKIFMNPFNHSDEHQVSAFYKLYAQGVIITDLDDFDPDYADLCVSPYEY